ncbi:hypothetical protein [Paraburkholderia sp. C35]|uniref:hypothetical protein n=1 Tax=Paraburkholderia sp. C35 TaxID=2126993 RepID=UPI000D688177|nr:hypothetical protein [Paraburkholderia sp. C35]
MTEHYIERLNRMTPEQLQAEREKERAYHERVRNGTAGNSEPGKVEPMRAVIKTDRTGREITTYEGGSVEQWLGMFKPSHVNLQVKICNGSAGDFAIGGGLYSHLRG